MNCKRAQGRIITDYLDGEMSEKENIHLEEHLARCPECREFLASARKVGPELFLKTGMANPPEYLWRRVKETIITEEEKKAAFIYDILERIRSFLHTAKPALVAASIIILILTVSVAARLGIHSRQAMQIRAQDQVEYSDYLIEASGDVSANDNAGFGTSVEAYFL